MTRDRVSAPLNSTRGSRILSAMATQLILFPFDWRVDRMLSFCEHEKMGWDGGGGVAG